VSVQYQAYFDESGSHAGSHVLCVAGYVMEKRQARKLSRDWMAVLHAKGLPYFRMSECAHGNGPFSRLSKSDRIAVAKRVIEIIKGRTILGLAVTLNSDEFRSLMQFHPLIGGPYSFAAHMVLTGVNTWIERNNIQGKVAYFFEAGHESRPEANRIMAEIFSHENLKNEYRYGGHAFVEKEEAPAVQAADLLAWQWYTDKRHEMEGRPRRKDCASLLEHWHVPIHIGRERLIELSREWGLAPPERQTLERLYRGDQVDSAVA
jgi:Protein of unknown function (DUF3800)